MICVDSDCDGYTSAALLLNYIYARFPSAIGNFTYYTHEGKTHGLHDLVIDGDTALVIAPDSSSNDYEIHEALSKEGVEVLVLDHHQAEYVSPFACVVNNQLCDYPTKSLSGVGIVYKLCEYIDELCGDELATQFSDIVALGLIADMMDTRDLETHYLIQAGLNSIRNSFIAAMAERNSYSLGDELTPIGVAFYIVPYINAVTRVGSMAEKLLLFESFLTWKADELIPSTKRGMSNTLESRVEQAVRTCINIKNRQTREQDEMAEKVEVLIARDQLLEHKVLVIKMIETYDKGITGLIANKIMAKYQRPVCLLSPTFDEEGKIIWSGSARGYQQGSLTDFRQFVRDSGFSLYAEGHPNAFGTAFPDEYINLFIHYADKKLANIHFAPMYRVDFVWHQDDLIPDNILAIGNAKALWGQEISEPYVAVENLPITADKLTLMSPDKKPAIKIQLPNGVAFIKFKSSYEEYQELYSETGCVYITLVGRCNTNKYYNTITPQIIIEDYEITNRQQYYF